MFFKMAVASNMARRQVLVLYSRNMNHMMKLTRTFSSQGPSSSTTSSDLHISKATNEDPLFQWLDVKRGIFGPDDKRVPLPGNVGLAKRLKEVSYKHLVDSVTPKVVAEETGVVNPFNDLAIDDPTIDSAVQKYFDTPDQTELECKIQECPDLLKKEFEHLIPFKKHNIKSLNVITLCQKTINRMDSWSNAMEEEREELTEQFVSLANRIRDEFQLNGFWCDFVDPSSGQLYYGDHTNDSLFDTDERYKKLGFTINDLGCCKVLVHKKWGCKVFVGAIFTDAQVGYEPDLKVFMENLCGIRQPDEQNLN